MAPSKIALLAALVAGASAFTFQTPAKTSTALFNGPVLGSGGMADTRDPDAFQHEDPRKSISEAPSFEEYLKMRSGGAPAAPAPAAAAPAPAADPYAAWGAPAAAPPAPPAPAAAAPAWGAPAAAAPAWGAPAAPAPAAAAPAWGAPAAAAPAAAAPAAGGSIVDTLASLQGPGQVWGADGIAVGKEESELKGYDNFGKFFQALQSTGVAAEIAGAGPFTVFAPTDSALETYETMRGPIDANVVKMHIVPGNIASSAISSAQLTTIGGQQLVYRYAVRKNFVNDAIIGEKTFGPYADFPIDVACSNGVIHAVGLCFAM